MRAATRERMIRIMAGTGLVAILSFSWLGQAAAGARTASRHQRRNVPYADVGRLNGCLRGYKFPQVGCSLRTLR